MQSDDALARSSNEIEDAFTKASGPGGPFSKIGQGVADAIGAGFNVSGRSSLILFLIPLVGAIVGLVLAAVQAANALVAVLATVPALIAGIGIQVAVLALAFHGLGTAIRGRVRSQERQGTQRGDQGSDAIGAEVRQGAAPCSELLP